MYKEKAASKSKTEVITCRSRGYWYLPTRERNLLALPTLDMYLPLVRGPRGLVPVVATASFPLINLPNFYLSFTILVSLILVKYPDRVGLVNRYPRGRYLLVPACLAQLLAKKMQPAASPGRFRSSRSS